MNRGDFFEVLRRELRQLPQEEIQNALVYHTEYFDDAGAENEQRVIDELGDPAIIAAQIIADYKEKNPGFTPAAKKGHHALWWVLLILFGIPIGFPVAIALVAIVFSLFVGIAAILFALWLVPMILCIVGVALFVTGFPMFLVTPLGAVLIVGAGLALTGAGVLLGTGVFLLTACCGKLLTKLIELFTRRKNGGNQHV